MSNTEDAVPSAKPRQVESQIELLRSFRKKASSLLNYFWSLIKSVSRKVFNFFSGALDNLWVTSSMTALIAWSAYHYQSPMSSSVPQLLLMACGATCLIALLILKDGPVLTAFLSAVVLIVFALIGVVGSNHDVSRLLPFDGDDFIRSNRERWETIALCSTAFMAIIYLDALDVIKTWFAHGRGAHGIALIMLGLAASVLFIFLALLKLHHLNVHFFFVWVVTVLFALVDLYIWRSLTRSATEEARAYSVESRALLFLLDIPVFVALTVLGLFVFFQLNCPAEIMQESVPIPSTFESALRNGCVEAHPFLAGALAFQMLSYNAIYVIFLLGLHTEK